MVENAHFFSPAEAVFVFMQQAKEIEPHDDLKNAILKKAVEVALKDIEHGRTYSMEEVQAILDRDDEDNQEPAEWVDIELDPANSD